jgi:very-short-patch-repair endonuclease
MGAGTAVGRIVSVTSKLRRDRARRLRRDQTPAEARLWDMLRGGRLESWKWRRQVPVGPFIVDFLCLEAAVAVELDGGAHAEQALRDVRRDAFLRRKGLQVLRFWNSELVADPERVAWKILSACRESEPSRRGDHIDRHRRPALPSR